MGSLFIALASVLIICLQISSAENAVKDYEPNWDSLDTRPLPGWYDDAKFGIFIHWGVFSVPSFGSEWFWNYWKGGSQSYVDFMNKNYKPGFSYPEFGPMFTAEFYNPDFWADLFKDAGAKYVVLTSKHHEGFTMWGSPVSWNWNAVDIGPKRDLLGDLANSIRSRTDVRFGVYHSLFEWFNPLYLQDKKAGFTTQDFVFTKTMPELKDLVETYKPEIVWSDGDGEAADKYWDSTNFIAWLYNTSPVKDTVVTNDRWGSGVMCNHGDFYTCADRYNPGVVQKHKWENCMTIDKWSWGYRRDAKLSDYMTIEELLQNLVSTVSCNGNLLLNIGPTHDGRIAPIFEERLRQMGAWLKVNGEAIYGSKPWAHQNDTVTPNVWYTSNSSSVYAMVLFWPADNKLYLDAVVASSETTVTLLGYEPTLTFDSTGSGLTVTFPTLTEAQLPCQWAWTLKLEGVTPKPARPETNEVRRK